MKKIILTTLISLFAVSVFADDMVIQPNQLPQNSQKFITDTFKGMTIVAALKDIDSFEASLSNGTKVKFNMNGEWDEIEGYTALPDGILPVAVEKTAKSQGGQIVSIDKDFTNFDVKLNNNIELKIDMNGKILKKEMD